MRSLRLGLAASLILNVFLLASIGGGLVWLADRPGMIFAGSMRIAGSELPPAESRAFRQTMRDTRLSLHDTVVDARKARREVIGLLRQPNLDQQALSAALDKLRTAEMHVRTEVEHSAAAFVATLSPADRMKMADAMERRVRPRRLWRWWRS
jgi:uncharacterized membrane protein